MKTSAGIFCRQARDRARAIALFASVVLVLASCATARYDAGRVKGYAVASWYGEQFHGLLTSSGEPYDMDGLTCAHKTLPFGTRLKVTNVDNDKSVVVTVTDRGPFVEGRDIDLSRGAARKIGIYEKGVGKVYLEQVGRDMKYAKRIDGRSTKLTPLGKGPFTIQLAAFLERDSADRLRRGIELSYKGAYTMEKTVDGKRFFRVRVGKFDNEREAISLAKTLSDEGYNTSILTYEAN